MAELIQNVRARACLSLNGAWRIIVDPYDAGFSNIFGAEIPNGYFRDLKPRDEGDRVEYDFDRAPTLEVPGDWNSQDSRLLYYEGSLWYRREFDSAPVAGVRTFLHFGAANYEAHVYLNGGKLGVHQGGFGPFEFEITDRIREGRNFVVVRVDNRRTASGVPGLRTDWWNYGGLTRDVLLVEVPTTFIRDYRIQLAPSSSSRLRGWVRLDGPDLPPSVRLRVPGASLDLDLPVDGDGLAVLDAEARLRLWAPDDPWLYEVEIEAGDDRVEDRIGFRTLETRGSQILLNGEPIFLRGISIHEEAPLREGRAHGEEDACVLLGWALELGCNFVRLAHYPHDEAMVRVADEMGLLVWAELPVYWGLEWENEATWRCASEQLEELIGRDRNRACVAFWSVGNEAPPSEPRVRFFRRLIDRARELDDTRLLTAALLTIPAADRRMSIEDPLGEHLDVLGCNQYYGWYYLRPDEIDDVAWSSIYDKPVIMSELGAGARQGLHGRPTQRWTEEYQVAVYEHQIRMLRKIPFLAGLSPWILRDFRSPRRVLPGVQDGYNRKGLISDRGERKAAFEVLRGFYRELAGGD